MTEAEMHAEKMARLRAETAAMKAETARLRRLRKAITREIAKAGR